MATYGVTDTQLTAIADAIRLKRDIVTEMTVDDMPLQIGLIDGGGGTQVLDGVIQGTTTSVSSNATSIRNYAFYGGTQFTSMNFPEATAIGNEAFRLCENLAAINFPKVTTIGSSAFRGCTSLLSVNMEKAESIGNSAFYGCNNLIEVNLPNVTTLGSSAFNSCSRLSSVYLPKLTAIQGETFYNNGSLVTVHFPAVTQINGGMAFRGCGNLEVANFPALESLGSNHFLYCNKLTTLILGLDSVCELSAVSALNNTPFASNGTGGTLYVPRDLIASYQAANNWSTILGYPNNQIKAIEDMA